MSSHKDSSGAVVAQKDTADRFADPGIPPHGDRVTDIDPRAAKSAERLVAFFFVLSIVGTLLFFFGYFFMKPSPEDHIAGVRTQNLLLGLGTAFAMFGIGIGIVQWAKSLMPDHEIAEDRHEIRPEEDRRDAAAIINQVLDESGVARRPLIRNTLIAAGLLAPLPAIAIFRDLSPSVDVDVLRHTLWAKGVKLVRDPDGTPIRAADVQLGSAFHVIPENLESAEHKLNEKAKAVVLLMRLDPAKMKISEGRENWHVDGIVAYSKICTHVGCPVALYEQHTHHLLCPCHQSTFDLTQECKVIFGPAGHALPQLPIEVDADGYLVAQSDFHEPVGPSYWERG
ncbi:ubiquinol-cytochrome c reductase iron-sulfur subunit [Falsarthrobacter nasiphocae]|uniref:Cytochrome bc1 complex Rieske iron-sulfur subunit n=1 Tax=Falsarthrobacter nasiphocae TaxID=189863 RepID=A0AAE3YDC8_9MICC|nr:Rieske 2Fe-2S domain-containing protein [Falsarthrobacter nasiphocae]MDR6891090.1 ubiquinol-cytochrome c reductase iron-sulfur subunit [Falsarthrobacter nasiphocae]